MSDSPARASDQRATLPTMASISCQIARWVSDEPFPGVVEAEFVDAAGEHQLIVDKVAIFTSARLTARSELPFPRALRCRVITDLSDDGILEIELLDCELATGGRRLRVACDELQPDTSTLWRPVGRDELRLIERTEYRRFPPRLPEQTIFYPVLNFEYAEQIARDWNSKDSRHANVGYVTQFDVRTDFLERYESHQVGGRMHREYWIPAEDLESFNDAVVGPIRVVAEYRHGERVS